MRRKGPVLWIAVTALLALAVLAVVCAPYISQTALRRVNAIPGIHADRALVTLTGIGLENVSFSETAVGVKGRYDRAHLGWLAVLGLSRTVEVEGGSVNLPDARMLLSSSDNALPNLAVRFQNLGATIVVRGRHLVMTGASGSAIFSKGVLAELNLAVEQVGGLARGFSFSYDREQANSIHLRLNLAGIGPFLGGDVSKMEGVLTFSGSLDPESMESRGHVLIRGVELETPYTRLSGLKAEGEATLKEGAPNLDIKVTAGILEARDRHHDFGLHPATLAVQTEENDGTIVARHFRLDAPGWVIMNLDGTVDRTMKVNLTAHLKDVSLKPLMETESIRVTTSGSAARTIRITGVWPGISYDAVTTVSGLSFSVPGIHLDITGVEAGPLEGKWSIEKADEDKAE